MCYSGKSLRLGQSVLSGIRRLRVRFPSGAQKHFFGFVIKLEEQTVYYVNMNSACNRFLPINFSTMTKISNDITKCIWCRGLFLWLYARLAVLEVTCPGKLCSECCRKDSIRSTKMRLFIRITHPYTHFPFPPLPPPPLSKKAPQTNQNLWPFSVGKILAGLNCLVCIARYL